MKNGTTFRARSRGLRWRPARVVCLAALAVIAALASGCGSDTGAADDAAHDSTHDSQSSPASAGGSGSSGPTAQESIAVTGRTVRITPEGVAGLVAEHLGEEQIEGFSTYGPDRASTDVFVEMVGAGDRDLFSVGAVNPDGPEGRYQEAPNATCEKWMRRDGKNGVSVWCEDLEEGGGGYAVVIWGPGGFSDDNAEGGVLYGMATVDGGRMASAMYETYVNEVPMDGALLLDLLADPRLAWATEPAVNRADVEVSWQSG